MSEERQIRYMPQLDALRCFAVVAVMLNHFIPEEWPLYHLFPLGTSGVFLFFVLSGYLITKILLNCRPEKHAEASTSGVLKAFYIRRFLRIFPIYYLAILVAALLGLGATRATLWWLISYTSNFYFAIENSWALPVSHFWSLAVEEQFYIIWPCVVLLTPRRYLMFVTGCAIICAPLFRLLCFQLEWGRVAALALLPGCSDMLGFGALLAIWEDRGELTSKEGLLTTVFLRGGLIIFVGLQIHYLCGAPSVIAESLRFTALGMVFTWCVFRTAIGVAGRGQKIMENSILIYLGKISYGLYIYHNFVRFVLTPHIQALGLNQYVEAVVRVSVMSAVTILLSALSWRLFESPLNRLKRRYPYYKKSH